MGKNKLSFLVLWPFICFVSCSLMTGKAPVAKVGDKILYLSEIESILPGNISREDSILLSEDYIKKWIRNELLIKKAEENLSPSQRDVSKELEEYRNSLIIYRYKKELVTEKMDTLVSDQEISDFYDNNKENLRLESNLVKAITIKIPLEVTNPEQVKSYCESFTEENQEKLRNFCLKYGIMYNLYLESWVDAQVVFQTMPRAPSDLSSFLSNQTIWETRDSSFYYLAFIRSSKPRGSVPPPEFVRADIKSLIVNNRKIDFLKKIEDDVYLEGLRNHKFKLYENEKVPYESGP